jgi:hypothetical protein
MASTQPRSGALVQANPSGAQASTGVANFNLVFLGAALATSLSLAGGIFHLTRRVRLRDYGLALPNVRLARMGYRVPAFAPRERPAAAQAC